MSKNINYEEIKNKFEEHRQYLTMDSWDKAYQCAIDAIDKQIPKKPITFTNGTRDYYVCPCCNKLVSYLHGCSNNDCRQAIDWE